MNGVPPPPADWTRRFALAFSIGLATVFLLATVPRELPGPGGSTQIHRFETGGIEFGVRSLLTTEPGPPELNSTRFVHGGFAVEFVIQPAITGQDYIGSVLSYSAGPHFNWAVEQHDRSLYLLHRSRSIRFTDVLDTEHHHHYLYVADRSDATLYIDGQRVGSAPWDKEPKPWADDARLTIGNLDWGDYPWQGNLLLLRIYDEVPSATEAQAIHACFVANCRESAAIMQLAELANGKFELTRLAGAAISLKAYEWPAELKYQDLFRFDKQIINHRDLLLNVLATVLLGFAIAAWLERGSTASVIGRVFLATLTLSLFAETTQFFSPERFASFVDVAMNTLGAVIGATLFLVYRRFVEARSRRALLD